jgi:hypothetical protein
MDIYTTTNYRKIWEHFNGPIPKDEQGRSYEIHHIDGNHSNNHIDNLQCVSIQEHYDIHFSQNDTYACLRISQKLKMTQQEISDFATKLNNERWSDPEYYARMLEINNTPEIRKLRSNNLKRQWDDPEFRDNMVAIRNSPEYLEERSKISSKVWSNTAKREALSKKHKETWSDPKKRQEQSERRKKYFQTAPVFHCSCCNRDIKGQHNWNQHLNSKQHQNSSGVSAIIVCDP